MNVLEKPGFGQSDTYGALDLGTNNCRLLIAKADSKALSEAASPGTRPVHVPKYRIVDAFSRIVRLGEGLEKKEVASLGVKFTSPIQKLIDQKLESQELINEPADSII